jgi:phage terminase large subunit-like protein
MSALAGIKVLDLSRVLAGPWVRLACRRHLDDLEHGAVRGLTWSPEHAAHAMGFCELLTLADGQHAGQLLKLHPAQQFILGSLFGWLAGDGFRRYRYGYIEMGKGNGKTPLAAGAALYLMVADEEYGAEVYSAAVGRDQALIAYRDEHGDEIWGFDKGAPDPGIAALALTGGK